MRPVPRPAGRSFHQGIVDPLSGTEHASERDGAREGAGEPARGHPPSAYSSAPRPSSIRNRTTKLTTSVTPKAIIAAYANPV